MPDPLIRGLQERVARALPAERIEHHAGWWLRSAPGCSWWVGSVLPHGADDPRQVLSELVARAERFNAEAGVPTRFQITPGACPPRLDSLLADRGYRIDGRMSLRVASAEHVREATADRFGRDDDPVQVRERPDPDWFRAWCQVHGSGIDREAEWRLLERVRQPSAYAAVRLDGRVVAVGRAVLDTGCAGLFGMGTLPEARGGGHARTVLAELAAWAVGQQVDRLYLQVEQDNAAAGRLYQRAGFTELTGYHYRVRSGPAQMSTVT